MVRMIAPVVGLLAAGAAASPTATCSSLSQTDFKWSVSAFSYNSSIVNTTPSHQNDNGLVLFNVSNPAFPQVSVRCRASSVRPNDFFYGDQVYDCWAGLTPEGGLATTFTFDAPSNTLALNQSWTCPGENTSFEYKGTIDLSSTIKCQATEYTNPHWTIGEIYRTQTSECSVPDFKWAPSSGSAVAK